MYFNQTFNKTNITKNLYFWKVYFCVCNFLSTSIISLLSSNILKSYKGLGDYKIFNQAFPFTCWVTWILDPVFESFWVNTIFLYGKKIFESLEPWKNLKQLKLISTNNYICFVIIKTLKPSDCNLGPTNPLPRSW